MTKLEKLAAMEELWADLSSPQEELEMPAWHGDILKERENALKEGKGFYQIDIKLIMTITGLGS